MNNKSHHVYYTPMSKRAEKEKENKLDESEFPSLTKSKTSTSIVANANAIVKPILNFLEAAKKPPVPEEESMVHSENKSDSESENDTKNEPIIFKKGLSFD